MDGGNKREDERTSRTTNERMDSRTKERKNKRLIERMQTANELMKQWLNLKKD